MANKKIIIGSLFVVAGVWYWSSRQTLINNVTIAPSGIGTGGDFLNPKIILQLMAQNPSTGSAKVNSINANISYQGNVIGVINMVTPFTIAPNSNTPFSVPINISDISVLLSLYNVIVNGDSISIDINGNAKIDAFTLPINQTVSI
jgi:LEA14-like dessication related protein